MWCQEGITLSSLTASHYSHQPPHLYVVSAVEDNGAVNRLIFSSAFKHRRGCVRINMHCSHLHDLNKIRNPLSSLVLRKYGFKRVISCRLEPKMVVVTWNSVLLSASDASLDLKMRKVTISKFFYMKKHLLCISICNSIALYRWIFKECKLVGKSDFLSVF